MDDILCYASNVKELLESLKKVFLCMRKFNIKLNPLKTILYALEVV